jgi:hypothetical protein
VGGRNLLVIGSQCRSLAQLSFLPDVATKLYQAMNDPDRGACQPALEPSGLVIDPTVAEAKKAIRMAFERAANDEATLLLAFIGHGEVIQSDDFYFLPIDAEFPPRDDTALNLVYHVRDLRRQYETDGLIVLVDTSYSGTGAVAAGKAWPGIGLGEFRFEFLAATADRPAFDGCFSKNLVRWVQAGMSGVVGDLRCETVRIALADRCPNQQAQLMSYQSDPGLFLAHNLAPPVREAEAPIALSGLDDGIVPMLNEAQGSDLSATGRHYRIFLCHSSGDKRRVRRLYRRLCEKGFDPWLDEENIVAGQDLGR